MRTTTLIRPQIETGTARAAQIETGAARTARRWRVRPPTGALALSRPECLHRLAGQDEGRLHHMTGVGPRALIVRYARYQNGLWIAVPDQATAGHRPRQEMALEVNGLCGDDPWVVVVAGCARQVHPARCPHAPIPGLPRHQTMQHLFLPATVVFGFSC